MLAFASLINRKINERQKGARRISVPHQVVAPVNAGICGIWVFKPGITVEFRYREFGANRVFTRQIGSKAAAFSGPNRLVNQMSNTEKEKVESGKLSVGGSL